MERSWRDVVANAATPWEWRSRSSVVTLLIVMVAATALPAMTA